MGEVRKWEDLELDCLANILGRVGMESLVLDVPFVCKSWYKASHNPFCWKHLDIPPMEFASLEFYKRFIAQYWLKSEFNESGFIRMLLSRGLGKSTSIVLPRGYHDSDLQLVADICPELKSLSLMWGFMDTESSVPKLIAKFKYLEEFTYEFVSTRNFTETMAHIGQNCKNFHTLSLRGVFKKESALAIANHLPKIKNLILTSCYFEQEHLEIILCSCKELAFFDVNKCKILQNIWQEDKIRELASHIKVFNLDASYIDSSSSVKSDGVYVFHLMNKMFEDD